MRDQEEHVEREKRIDGLSALSLENLETMWNKILSEKIIDSMDYRSVCARSVMDETTGKAPCPRITKIINPYNGYPYVKIDRVLITLTDMFIRNSVRRGMNVAKLYSIMAPKSNIFWDKVKVAEYDAYHVQPDSHLQLA